MSTRYIVDAEGRPVEAIMDLDELRQVLEAQRQLAEATANVERMTRELADAEARIAQDCQAAVNASEIARSLQVIQEAQKTLSAFVDGLEELEEREEEREAVRAFDEDAERIERGEAELIPWEESKRQRRQLR